MSQTDQQNGSIASNVDQYTDDLTNETTEAVQQIARTVDQAAQAADQALDLGDEVTNALDALSRGNRAAAIDAALSLLDDESGAEAREAVAALKATKHELERSWNELEDVADLLADAVSNVEDAAQKSAMFQRLADLFDERAN